MALTTDLESSSATSPKTTCFPSSQSVTTVVMKNWEPFLIIIFPNQQKKHILGSLSYFSSQATTGEQIKDEGDEFRWKKDSDEGRELTCEVRHWPLRGEMASYASP